MTQRIRHYVEELFANAPHSKKAYDLKEEIYSNLVEKYQDLTAEGMPENEAYNTVIAGIGDVEEMFEDLKDSPASYPAEDAWRSRSAVLVSVSVGLYILSLVPLFLIDALGGDPIYGVILMFVFCAVATALLIYNTMSRPRYHRLDDTMVEEFKEWKHRQAAGDDDRQLCNAIISIFWILLIAVYLLVSFLFGIWAYSWILFIIGAAVSQIINTVFKLRGSRHD